MIQNIDLYNPDFIVDCASLQKAADIYGVMKSNGIKKMYCYAFFYRKNMLQYDVLKIGESCPEPNTHKPDAERLDRQIRWLEGWTEKPKSGNGVDFYMNILNEVKEGNLSASILNRNNINIGVWNLDCRTNSIEFVTAKDREITTWVEAELAQQYKDTHFGDLPILNYKDPTRNSSYIKKARIKKDTLSSLFHFN